MAFFEQRYYVNSWRGTVFFLTAEELYKRVMEDSKSDYDWIASATELVRICKKPDFPKEYSQGIKIAILNCFANLETKKEYPSHQEATDNDAVYFCYNSLSGTDEEIIATKRKYLSAIIHAITLYHFELPIHYSPVYTKICEEWEQSKFEEWCSKEKINFKNLIKELDSDFDKTIKAAEGEKAFF